MRSKKALLYDEDADMDNADAPMMQTLLSKQNLLKILCKVQHRKLLNLICHMLLVSDMLQALGAYPLNRYFQQLQPC